MLWITRLRFSNLTPLLSGVLLWLAFPPVDWYGLTWIALIPLARGLLRSSSPSEAGRKAFGAGFVFFLLNLSWMVVLSEWAGFLIYIGWFLLAFYLALFYAFWGGVWHRFSPSHPFPRVLLGTALFALFELLRSSGRFGYPFGLLRETVVPLLPLLQFSAWTGGLGLTALIVCVNLSLAEFIRHKRMERSLFLLLSLLAITILTSHRDRFEKIKAWESSPHKIRIGVVQGNIPQKEKMNPAAQDRIFTKHIDLTRQLFQNSPPPELVIWPETALLAFLSREPRYVEPLQQLAQRHRVAFLMGTPELGYQGDKTAIFNSLIVMEKNGVITHQYHKEQLVPFGEYLPFRPLLERFFKGTPLVGEDFTPSEERTPLTYQKIQLIPAICFESAFEEVIRRRVTSPHALIVIVTNDAWFYRTSIVTEHLRHAALRAVENRLPVIQVANTGFSAFVSPAGEFQKISHLEEPALLSREISIGAGGSFYTTIGFALFPASLLLCAGICAIIRLRGGEGE